MSASPASSRGLGTSLVLVSATAFGLVTTQSRLAYDAGSNPLTMVLVRVSAFALLFGAAVLLTGRSLRLSPRELRGTLWLAAMFLLMSAGYLGSVAFIPVSLAALVFFTFPFMVAAFSAAAGREPLTLPKLAALVVAFVGLALALGPGLEGLDWRGVACALGAAVGFALAIAFGGKVVDSADVMVVNVYTNLWMSLGLGAFMLGTGGIALPATGLGLAAMAGATLCYLVAYSCWFLSVSRVSPMRVAALYNLEPIVTISAAGLVLHERLAPLQLAGAALVIAAILAVSLTSHPPPEPAPPA